MAERIGRGLQRFFHADGADQHFPLAIGDRQRHHAAAVGRVERVAVGAIQEIAIGLAVGVVDFDLGQIAEVRGSRKCHIGQRQAHELALAGFAAMAFRGQDSGRQREPCDQVPRGQHMVDRPGLAVAGHHREAGCAVDRVVERVAAIRRADQLHHDHVGAARLQGFIGEFAVDRKVRHEDAAALAGRGDQVLQHLAALRAAHVDLDRTLALVEGGPVQALAVPVDRHAGGVDVAADRIDADHLGAQLREREAAQRGRDERGEFDDPQA
jgi:hypothetical protein